MIPGRVDYRILISTGIVVRAYTVVGQASPDGSVELVSLDLDTGPDWTQQALAGCRTVPGRTIRAGERPPTGYSQGYSQTS